MLVYEKRAPREEPKAGFFGDGVAGFYDGGFFGSGSGGSEPTFVVMYDAYNRMFFNRCNLKIEDGDQNGSEG